MHKKFCCDGTNKGIHIVAKIIYWWFKDRVLTFIVDCNEAVGDNASIDAASDN